MEILFLIILYFGSVWFLFSLFRRCETFSDYLACIGVCVGLLSLGIFIDPLDMLLQGKPWGMLGLAASLVLIYASIETHE
jgi:hypothetical protein